jgi:hypothetical protein
MPEVYITGTSAGEITSLWLISFKEMNSISVAQESLYVLAGRFESDAKFLSSEVVTGTS